MAHHTGMDVRSIADLDLLAFVDLAESTWKVVCAEKEQLAWTIRVAMNGDSEAMNALVSQWRPKGAPEVGVKDAKSFLSRFGKGI